MRRVRITAAKITVKNKSILTDYNNNDKQIGKLIFMTIRTETNAIVRSIIYKNQ